MKTRVIGIAMVMLCLGIPAQADVFDLGPGLTNLEMVVVGDPGNVGDTNIVGGSVGSVAYSYLIAKYEVTAAQYTDFLNHKAASDPYGLYNVKMWSEYHGCKVERTGTSGGYSYRVAADWANRPVNFVSFWDACRFVNWLYNGQGNGDTETGTYNLNGYSGLDGGWIQRNRDATWYLPSESEWYKAVYYKGNGTDSGYWDYPTQSDSIPSRLLGIPVDPGNNATYYNNGYTIDSPYYRTEVGAHENSESAYGTFDQGGNVHEWNDSVIIQSPEYATRGLLGGSYLESYEYLRSSRWGGGYPDLERAIYGFRVAAVFDTEIPTIAAPADVVAGTDTGVCCATAVNLGTPVTHDDRGVATVTNDAPAIFPKGPTSVTWTVTDTSGKTASDVQMVTVVDDEKPVVPGCPNVTICREPGAAGGVIVTWDPITAVDNCDGAVTAVCSPASGSTFSASTSTVVHITATDSAGNVGTGSFVVGGLTISDAKRLSNTSSVCMSAITVTYATPNYFYIEEDDRSAGIRVEKAAHGLTVGMRADITGTMATNTARERYISATNAVQSVEPEAVGSVAPISMANNSLGGGDWQVAGTGGQRGVTASISLNNVGLLVTVWGRYEQLDATTFTIDDGSGLNVRCTVPAGTFLNPDWAQVVVTGISSICKLNTTIYLPNVLIRDIQVMQPVEAVSVPGTPSGDANPLVDLGYEYTTSGSTCSQGHPVEYSFDWGDGTSSPWSSSTTVSHSWSTADVFDVTVSARCQVNTGISSTSAILVVTAVECRYTGEMVYIPAGSFLMGNSGVGDDASHLDSDEFPQHSVYLSGYWIGKYEVTRGEYRAFMDASGYSNPAYWSTAGWNWKVSRSRTQPDYWAAQQDWYGGQPFTQTDSHPVVGVSYYEAEAFCNWAGGHLPTEAQWEKTARWTGDHPNVYPWGDTWDEERCNNWDDDLYTGYQTAPVGSYSNGVSPYGCHDMAGNVSEWCSDWYQDNYYSQTPSGGWVNPQGPTSGSLRVLRGGGWSGTHCSDDHRCADRDSVVNPSYNWNTVGFRLAR